MIMPSIQETIELKTSIDQLSLLEAMIDRMHEDGHIPDELYGNVLVASTEALLNAIHHGNKEDRSKPIKVVSTIEVNTLTISVIDQGKGFDVDALPDPTDPENIEKLNGRGIFIIQNLTDEVEFDNNGATISMEFDLRAKELVDA
ncbi:MAG: hypothetical protein Salg2KO_15060 [Salibacteraceae bacterium]